MAESCGSSASTGFQDLIVWRRAHEFVLGVYQITVRFPPEERFGLTSQFRRAAVSVAANIAEGYRKRGAADKMRLFNIAEGSLGECCYYLILTRDLGYGDPAALIEAADEVGKLLHAYCRAIRRTAEERSARE